MIRKQKTIELQEYYAVVGSPYSDKDAAVIGPELHRLFSKGVTSNRQIVKEAKNRKSVLHRYFEWDDTVAGERWREEQARQMTKAIEVRVVVKGGEPEKVRAFFSVRPAPGSTTHPLREWKTIDAVVSNEELGRQVVADAKAELLGWGERYKKYRALFPIVEETFRPVFEFTDSLEKAADAKMRGASQV